MAVARETMEVDVLFVGAGPAGLAGAIRLADLARGRGLEIAVLEKGAAVGFHGISGAVMNPTALAELIPEYRLPADACEVIDDRFYYLTSRGKIRMPAPPGHSNLGFHVLSLAKLLRWMGEQAEGRGVQVFAGFPAEEILVEEGKVAGVTTKDTGLDRHGSRKANFEPGIDIRAKVTVLAEGVRGTLTRKLAHRFKLREGTNPENFALGIKEVWKVQAGRHRPGTVVHTLGFPLSERGAMGGGFLYHMAGGLVSLGLVVRLDYRDPLLDPHTRFQHLKTHPYVRDLLEGGQMLDYGARCIAEGGYFSVPRLAVGGALIVGEAANLVNVFKLKGIHYAMKSGMLAAETIHASLSSGDFSAAALAPYEKAVRASYIGKEMHETRNFHQALSGNLLVGLARVGLHMLTGGRDIKDRLSSHEDHHYDTIEERYGSRDRAVPDTIEYDDRLTFGRMSDVFASGSMHDEDQPCHLRVFDTDICHDRCRREYANPCTRFCPAGVYEMVSEEGGAPRLAINASNCVHCKTCDIADPYRNIIWTLPEGGGGPRYKMT